MHNRSRLNERVHRTKILFRELQYSLRDEMSTDEMYTCEVVDDQNEFAGGIYVDSGSKFLEIAYTYSFSDSMFTFLKSRIAEILSICYEYGSYCNMTDDMDDAEKPGLLFSIYAKIYYSGLNYHSLRDTLRDFRRCVHAVTGILDFNRNIKKDKEG